MLRKRQRQIRPSIDSAGLSRCQSSKDSTEWSISIIVHSIHLSSHLSLEMMTLGNCLLRNVRSLILRCLDLKGVKQQICCWLNLRFSPFPHNHWPLVFSTFTLVSRLHPTGVVKSSTCGVFLKSGNIFLCKHLRLLWPNAFHSHGLPCFYSLWVILFLPFHGNYIRIQMITSFYLWYCTTCQEV